MAEKRRHSRAEIAAKLARAEIMSQEGRSQRDIAHSLGVSVMTFHRWRKAHRQRAAVVSSRTQEAAPGADHRERIAELQLENSRLRRLVTDLLLAKLKVEEEQAGGRSEPADAVSIVPRLRVGSD